MLKRKLNGGYKILPNGEYDFGTFIAGPAGIDLIHAALKHRFTMAMIRMAEVIENSMKEQNISKKDMVNKMGISNYLFNKILNGSRNVTLEEMIRIEEILGINLVSNNLYETEEIKREYNVHYDQPETNK